MDDYRWLVGPEAEPYLRQVAASGDSLVVQTTRLRKELSAERTHRVIEQVELRRRARAKFARAAEMFFAPVALEQATDEIVARYKASRFPPGPAYDLCCGIGGDLLALAGRGPAIGIERDPALAILAEANAHVLGLTAAEVRTADVRDVAIDPAAAWHVDPDRRPAGHRTTRVSDHEPGPDVIERLLATAPAGAVKLAPAAQWPDAWTNQAELEWISRGGECRQLVAWFGPLARYPGRRSATVLAANGCARTIVAESSEREFSPHESSEPRGLSPGPPVAPPGRYVYEPDAAVLAAGLIDTLAAEHQLAALAVGCAYLTGNEPLSDPALAAFEVLDVLPYDVRRVRDLLRERGIGRLEVKKRGVPQDPEQVRRELRPTGDGDATLILAPLGKSVTALLTRRVEGS